MRTRVLACHARQLAHGLVGPSRVLPGVIERTVSDHDASSLDAAWQPLEIGASVVAQNFLCPREAPPRQWDAPLVCEQPENHQIVVPGDACRPELGDARDALVRKRPVSHEVTGNEVVVYAERTDGLQYCVESM